jgi:two-component system, NarL family, sensor histidine kinase DesK
MAGRVRASGAWTARLNPSTFWLVMAIGCLLFLIFPLRDLARSHPAPGRLVATLAGMALFVGLYLWLILHNPLLAAPLSAAETRRHVLLLVVIAGVVLALTVAASADWVWFVLYANLVAGVKLPVRVAAVTIPGLTALVIGGAAVAFGWPAIYNSPALATINSVSIMLIGVSWMVATIQELRAARQEIARLAAAEAVAEERLRFARDLHDLVGHSLSTITLKNELARRMVTRDPERAAQELDDAIATARAALQETRAAVRGYRQRTLATEFQSAREILVAAGIACQGDNSAGPLPPGVETVLAWAVREGVTNVVRHSRARHCAIRVARAGGQASAEVTDDGVGAPPDQAGTQLDSSNGLRGLAERAARQGGRVEAGRLATGGFRLHVTVPLSDEDLPPDLLSTGGQEP